MTGRERLIKLIGDSKALQYSDCHYNELDYCCKQIADYLLDSGVIVPPCKVGDEVYVKGKPVKVSFIYVEDGEIICGIQFDCVDCYSCPFYEDEASWEGEHDCKTNGYLEFTADDIGKTVFLTREEAEAALKEAEE